MLDYVGQPVGQAVSLSYNEAISRCHLVGFVDQLALRQGGSETFELANGRYGALMQESVVTRSPLIVVSEIREITTRQQEKLTLIGVASAVKPEWLRELHPPYLHESTEHVYNRLSRRVFAARILRYKNLAIGGEPVQEVNPAASGFALAREFVHNPHPASVPRWDRELKPWLLHVARLRALQPDLGLPEFDDEQIMQGLAQAWQGATSYKEAAARPLLPAFQALLDVDQQNAVEQSRH